MATEVERRIGRLEEVAAKRDRYIDRAIERAQLEAMTRNPGLGRWLKN
jgi:hypothetical protein